MPRPGLEQMITFLLDTPMFGDLDAGQLARVVGVMEAQDWPAQTDVFREGDAGDAWFVVYAGEVEVLKRDTTGRARRIGTVGPRGCFGEMAILDGSPRSATIRTTTPTTTLRIPRDAFNSLLAAGSLAAYRLVHQIALVLAARQRGTIQRLVELLAEEDATRAQASLRPLLDRSAVHG